jgi:hypothetical protein
VGDIQKPKIRILLVAWRKRREDPATNLQLNDVPARLRVASAFLALVRLGEQNAIRPIATTNSASFHGERRRAALY